MIGGSFIPPMYYSCFCEELKETRQAWATLLLTNLVAAVGVTFKFAGPEYAWLRATLFVFIGCIAVPMMVQFSYFLDKDLHYASDPFLVVLGGASYIFGAVLYACKFPEK